MNSTNKEIKVVSGEKIICPHCGHNQAFSSKKRLTGYGHDVNLICTKCKKSWIQKEVFTTLKDRSLDYV